MISRWCSALLFLAPLAAATPNLSVTVKNGTYVGKEGLGQQELFLGMPYAQPPLPPDLRLRAPQTLNSTWTGSRNATEYSLWCIGYLGGAASDDLGQNLGEDCLTLNVVRPYGVQKGSKVPVMLWIHGGGYGVGSGGDARYNGSWIVQRSVEMNQPIIFASINYRVAALGFLYGQEIADEETGNFGLLDQRKAIEWVHENIVAFGGDPSKVTIMGESAGAGSVANQLLAYGQSSTNLFRGGILESGTSSIHSFGTANSTQAIYDIVANSTGCASSNDTLACIRAVDVNTFIAATNVSTVRTGPVIDGHFIKQPANGSEASVPLKKIPLLLGQNTDEGTAFGVRGINNESTLVNVLRAQFSYMTDEDVDTLLEYYPDDPSVGCPFNTGDGLLPSGTQDKRSLAISGDSSMHAGRRMLAQVMAPYANVFSYRFDQPPDNATVEIGTTHFQEVAFVFSNPLPTINPLSKRPGDAELAQLMTSYWISFVVNQDPNHTGIEGAVKWPKYHEEAKNIVFKRQGSFVEDDDYRKDGIALLNELNPVVVR